MWIYSLGLKIIDIKKAKMIAALIPAAVISNMPSKPPNNPSLFIDAQEACASE